MDLHKLVDEMRTYRAQVEEAIAAVEELARRQGLTGRGRKPRTKNAAKRGAAKTTTTAAKRAAKTAVKSGAKPGEKNAVLRPTLVKPKRHTKRHRAVRQAKSR